MQDNYGCWWNGRDLRHLREMWKLRYPTDVMARSLGRSEGAVKDRIKMFRIVELANSGNDTDTLRNLK